MNTPTFPNQLKKIRVKGSEPSDTKQTKKKAKYSKTKSFSKLIIHLYVPTLVKASAMIIRENKPIEVPSEVQERACQIF